MTAWVHEFLDQCPAARRAEFKARYEEGKRIARRKAEYSLDAEEVLEGALVSYAHILSGKSPFYSRPRMPARYRQKSIQGGDAQVALVTPTGNLPRAGQRQRWPCRRTKLFASSAFILGR